jgi:hypothetical protein
MYICYLRGSPSRLMGKWTEQNSLVYSNPLNQNTDK